MRTFAQKPKSTLQTTSAKPAKPGRAYFGQRREVNSIHHLPRTIGNQALQPPSEANTRDIKRDSTTTGIASLGHDFGRMLVHTTRPIAVQPSVTTGTPGGRYRQAGEKGADDAAPTAHGPDSIAHDFGTLRIFPIRPPVARMALYADIPVSGESAAEIEDEPLREAVTAETPTPRGIRILRTTQEHA